MKKLTDMLMGNLGWKLLSLVAAVVMWFFVVNITNPTQEWGFQVQLGVLGEEKLAENNSLLLNAVELKSTYVVMRVKASVSTLREMNASNTLSAFVDLNPIDIVHTMELGQNLPVRVKYDAMGDGYEVVRVSPEEVDVVIDRYITRAFAIDIEKTDEDLEGYISMDPEPDIKMVTLSGPKSIIDTASKVKAEVSVSEANETFTVIRSLTVLNSEGADITGNVEMNASQVEITIPIEKYAKIPITLPETYGQMAEGYRIISRNMDRAYVEVEGNSAEIRKLKTIDLAPIDVTGLDRTKVEIYDIRNYLVGTGLNIREGTPTQVRVSLGVEQEITRTFEIPFETIEIRGMQWAVSLPTGVTKVVLTGIEDEINEYAETGVLAFIDVTGLEPGIYDLPLQADLPEGIRADSYTVEVIIEEPNDVPEEEDPEPFDEAQYPE